MHAYSIIIIFSIRIFKGYIYFIRCKNTPPKEKNVPVYCEGRLYPDRYTLVSNTVTARHRLGTGMQYGRTQHRQI